MRGLRMTQNEALVLLEALFSAESHTLENLMPCPIASRVRHLPGVWICENDLSMFLSGKTRMS